MTYKRIRITLLGSIVFFIASCSQAGAPVLTTEPLAQPTATPLVISTQTESGPESVQMTPTAQAAPSSGFDFLIEKAKEDLAQRLSVSTDQINLVEAREVVWPDASLGCPQPGMQYKQVPEDGALIVLQAQGNVYEYHTGGARGLFLCEKVYKDPSTPPKIDLKDLTPSARENNDPLIPSSDKNNPSPLTPDNNIPPGEDQ